MANIDSINAFIDGKESFAYLKNTLFVKGHVLYSYGEHWPLCVWYIGNDLNATTTVAINGYKRSPASSKHFAQAINELHRRNISTRIVTLEEMQEIINGK